MVEQMIEYDDHVFPMQDQLIDTSNDDNDELSHHHKVPSILDDLDWDDMTDMIHSMDTKPEMSRDDHQLAQQYKQKILSRRQRLINEKSTMCASSLGYSSHIYPKKEFQEKRLNYINQTGIYRFLNRINQKNPTVSQKCLKTIVKQVDGTLQDLLHSKSITDRQYTSMHPKRSTIRLNYLHFVSNLREFSEQSTLQPIIICKHGPTLPIIRYLSGILRSMFNYITHCKIFTNSDDLVYNLEDYVKHGCLQENTYFITFNINDISTKFSHEIMIKTLEKFLHRHWFELETMSQGLTNQTIIQLVRLVLQNQYFVYENKLYQQIHGSASGSLLTFPLACIYLFYGQSSLLIETLIKNKNELFFGRYQDNIFLTWNHSEDHFLTLFNQTRMSEPYLTILPSVPTVGWTVRFLDLRLKNEKGQLYTTIYHHHHPFTDDDDLPNQFQYHTCQPSNLLKAALTHAMHCCSNQQDFHQERRHIQKKYSIHGFSSIFIHRCVAEFYYALDMKTKFHHQSNRIPYEALRHNVLLNYERQQIAWKKKQQQVVLEKQQQQQTKKQYVRIPYPNHWDIEMVAKIKNTILTTIKKNLNEKEVLDDIEFELVPRRQIPMTLDDYIINKRPPLRLLCLSNKDIDEIHNKDSGD